MPWILFVEDFDYYPSAFKGRYVFAYRKTTVALVTRECAVKAIGTGKAQLTERPEDEARRRAAAGTNSVRISRTSR